MPTKENNVLNEQELLAQRARLEQERQEQLNEYNSRIRLLTQRNPSTAYLENKTKQLSENNFFTPVRQRRDAATEKENAFINSSSRMGG